jgi:hypothetical protein
MTEPKCPPAESLEEESQLARDEAVAAEILATRDLVAHLGILWETVERLDDLARRQAGYFAQDYLSALSGWLDCSPDNNRAAVLGTCLDRRMTHLAEALDEGVEVMSTQSDKVWDSLSRLWSPFFSVVRQDWAQQRARADT